MDGALTLKGAPVHEGSMNRLCVVYVHFIGSQLDSECGLSYSNAIMIKLTLVESHSKPSVCQLDWLGSHW